MHRYPNMSIRLPQRMSEAPVGPDARSFEGSTLKPEANPAAAEYIPPATSSSATAATAKEIATRLETRLMLLGAFPGGGESVGLEFGFRDIRRGAALGRTRSVLGLFIGGEEQHDDRAVRVLEDLPGRLEAVDTREVDVHQHQVRVQFLAGLDRGLTGFGFGDHLEAVRSLDYGPRRLPERRLIVHDQYPHCHVSRYRMAGFPHRRNGASTPSTDRPPLP